MWHVSVVLTTQQLWQEDCYSDQPGNMSLLFLHNGKDAIAPTLCWKVAERPLTPFKTQDRDSIGMVGSVT